MPRGAPFLAFFARSGAFHVHPSQTLQRSRLTILECLKVSKGSMGTATCISSLPAAIHRQPLLGSACRKDLFMKVLEQVRRGYDFVVVGYVVMPEHFHLLISEPDGRTPSCHVYLPGRDPWANCLPRTHATGIWSKSAIAHSLSGRENAAPISQRWNVLGIAKDGGERGILCTLNKHTAIPLFFFKFQ